MKLPGAEWMLVLGLLAGCGRHQTTVTAGNHEATHAGTSSDSASAEARLRRLEVAIDSLSRQVTGADRRLRQGLVGQIERLRTQRDSTARALDRLRASGREGWELARVGTDSMLGALDRAVQAAQARLRASPDTTR